jgi:hypothetical protein
MALRPQVVGEYREMLRDVEDGPEIHREGDGENIIG